MSQTRQYELVYIVAPETGLVRSFVTAVVFTMGALLVFGEFGVQPLEPSPITLFELGPQHP